MERKKLARCATLCRSQGNSRQRGRIATPPASPHRFRSPAGMAGIHAISFAQQSRLATAVGADHGPPSAHFLGAPADQSPEVLTIASQGASDLELPEHGPCLVGGTVTLDDVNFTTDIAVHSGGDAIEPYRCTALLDTGSPQTFIRRDVLDRMLSVGAASWACERPSSPRSWGGFVEYAPVRTATRIRLRVQFFLEKEPTCSLAVWACVVPPAVMQHIVLLSRDSWMRFNTRSYRALPPHPLDNRVLGELTLSHHATTGVAAYAVDPAAPNEAFHLRYDGTTGVTFCRTSPNCSRSTWCAVTALLRSQDTILSTYCRSRMFFRDRNTLLLQDDRCFPS